MFHINVLNNISIDFDVELCFLFSIYNSTRGGSYKNNDKADIENHFMINCLRLEELYGKIQILYQRFGLNDPSLAIGTFIARSRIFRIFEQKRSI